MSEAATGRHARDGDEGIGVPATGDHDAEQVTCPECGTVAPVRLTRRESHDFCARCDFPLFWTPTTIVLDRSRGTEDALRRLPGTAGRQTIASRRCPHCAEANPLGAVTCVRCGQSMVLAAAPAPVAVAPPPVLEEDPPGTPWWVWAIGAATFVLLVVLVVFLIITS